MAWTDLKASIAQVIRTNGNQEITGALLQLTLNSIVDQLGADATLKGVATPATNPNNSDGIAFYIASELGTYANFGGLKVNSGEIAVFYSNGTEWTKMSIDLTQTIAESISDSEATLLQEIAESEGRSGTALSTARGEITQEIAAAEGRSGTALSTARGAITQEIAESEGRSGTALSTAIGAITQEIAEIGYLFGSSLNILNSVSNSIAKLQAFGKPNITVNGNSRTIIYPNNFNINIGNSVTIPVSLLTDGLKSIEITVTKLTKRTDFTFTDDKGKAYISDSIDIIDGKLYYTERIEKKIWHTGDAAPTIYLSTSTNGLVDGCTIYTPLVTSTTTEISDVSVIINNGETITSNKPISIYYELQYFIAKKSVDDPIVLTKMSHLNSLDGITVKSRSLAYDEENEILYFCGYSGTLYKIDVSDDAHPLILGSVVVNTNTGRVCSGCAITSDYLYVVDRNEGIAKSPSYLTIINKSNFTIVNQINLFNQADFYAPTNSAQSPCSCYIFNNYLYICENSYFWAIYDITTNPELPTIIYQQTYASYADKTYREYQRAASFTDGVNNYVAFAGFTSGVSIWNVNDVYSPLMVGSIKTSVLFDYSTTQFQTMDVVVDYPYMYIPCCGTLSTRYSHFPINRSILTFDLSDLNVYTNGVDYINNPDLFSISNIPYKFYPNILNEGDPAPSRIIKVGNMLAVNYAEAGVAIFKVINNKPVFQSCYKLSGEGNTCQSMRASNKGRLFISNIYGKDTGMQVYRLGNMDF